VSQGRKKPISKKVSALQQQLRRKTGIRELAKRFLIVCEDTEAAPHYFEAFKRHYKLSATSVEVLGSDHATQPIQVVQRALERQKIARRGASGTLPFSEAWCIIDGDYGVAVDVARNIIKDDTTKLAVSTPCFEYWVLLHFEESAQPAADCDEVMSTLRAGPIPDYDKGTCSFDQVVQHARDAASRASKLRELRKLTDPLPENHNPCSEVYLLVEKIL
jgi:hypothetical protein